MDLLTQSLTQCCDIPIWGRSASWKWGIPLVAISEYLPLLSTESGERDFAVSWDSKAGCEAEDLLKSFNWRALISTVGKQNKGVKARNWVSSGYICLWSTGSLVNLDNGDGGVFINRTEALYLNGHKLPCAFLYKSWGWVGMGVGWYRKCQRETKKQQRRKRQSRATAKNTEKRKIRKKREKCKRIKERQE